MPYTIRDHYWHVAGDDSNVYSSRYDEYMPLSDQRFVDWLAAAPDRTATNILNEDELGDVIAEAQGDRPTRPNILDGYKKNHASKLTKQVVAKSIMWLINNQIAHGWVQGRATDKQLTSASEFRQFLQDRIV